MGPEFLLTMAPVATALLPPEFRMPHMSGFSYFDLAEHEAGALVAWYNAQFYNGWGNAANPLWYDAVISAGWDPAKVVYGLITSPENGSGFVNMDWMTRTALPYLNARHPRFGGVMGWEYFNSEPGGEARPWQWTAAMSDALRQPPQRPVAPATAASPPQLPFAPNDLDSLMRLARVRKIQGFALLIHTGGNVEQAVNLLRRRSQ